MLTLLTAFCDLPPLTVCVCFTAATAEMSQSSPATGWSSSCRRRRRISSGSSRWAEKWSSTSSGSFSTTRRRIRLSRCSSLQTPCRPFKDIRAKVTGEPVQGTSSACWTEASKLSCLGVRVCQVITRPPCARRCGLCALIKLWRLWSCWQTEANNRPRGWSPGRSFLGVSSHFLFEEVEFRECQQWHLQDPLCNTCTAARGLKNIFSYLYLRLWGRKKRSPLSAFVLPCVLTAISNVVTTITFVSVSHPVNTVAFLWDDNFKFPG